MRALVMCLAATLGIAAQTPAQPVLERVRQHMVEKLARQPNYTCLETVERARRDGAGHKFQIEDTLRMEVALVNGKEMFAWPGSKQFEDRDIREFVPSGMFGTGDFALHARVVFGSNVPTFETRGEWPLEGHTTLRFDFRVLRAKSGYRVRIRDLELPVGYHGSFYADPQSFDVRRLEVIADDIPAELKMSQISDFMDYSSVPMEQGEFLLPAATQVSMVDLAGQESRNRVQFTACRQFMGKSVLSFEDPNDAPIGKIAKREVELPPGVLVTLRLTEAIDLEKSAIGDQVRAQVANDLKVKGLVILPKGSIASGRISRIERHADFTLVGLIFSDLDSENVHAPMKAVFERMAGTMPVPVRNPRANAPVKANEAVVVLQSGGARLSRGILLFWRT